MTTFAQLFPSGPRRGDSSPVDEDHHTVRRLREMIGDPRDEFDMATPRSRTRLTELVAAAGASSTPALAWAPPDTRKRPRRRLDVFSGAAAALAIVALATAGIVAGVQTANADPAGDAMQSLRADEESIASAESALAATRERLTTGLETGAAGAASLRAAVEAAREAPAPWLGRNNRTVAVLDGAQADEIIAEIDRHVAALQTVVVADLPAPYERGALDAGSLEEVGSAIGSAQEHLTELDGAAEILRGTKSGFDAIEAEHAAAMEAFAAGFAESGAAVIEEYEDADDELRDAVTAAAAAVVASKLSGAEGVAAINAYRDAVVALLEDQRGGGEVPRSTDPGRDSGTTDQGTTDPGATDPGTGSTPAPEEPSDPIIVVPPVDGDGTQP